jgi:tetratricopeptide (TPR) repeat protein
MKNNITLILFICISLLFLGCKKFLDAKPDSHLQIPETLSDFQALLDYYPTFNNSDPASGEVSADNYYLSDADYLGLSQDVYRNTYTWQKDDLFLPQSNDWYFTYQPVFSANTILEGVNKIVPNLTNQLIFNNVKGQALFVRGRATFLAASLWAAAYDQNTANEQLGVPIRVGTDFNKASARSSLQETYSSIISDLTEASRLLPVTPLQTLRSSKPAAFALLARAYLSMRDYQKAGLYADSCLQLYSKLIDYNDLEPSLTYPITRFNEEVIFDSRFNAVPIVNTRAKIDTVLYNSYSTNDLRKTIFFKTEVDGSHYFKGSYEGSIVYFGGVAIDEVFLMRAECFARAGNTEEAMQDLNTLLATRFKKGTFVNFTAASSVEALQIILMERRKELVMRNLRWMDLKRLNAGGDQITLTRKIDGKAYSLLPNDPKYALPIPDDIIQLTGMQQNIR